MIRQGFTFESDTDTEVIPKLAKFVFDKAHDGDGTASSFFIEWIVDFLEMSSLSCKDENL